MSASISSKEGNLNSSELLFWRRGSGTIVNNSHFRKQFEIIVTLEGNDLISLTIRLVHLINL